MRRSRLSLPTSQSSVTDIVSDSFKDEPVQDPFRRGLGHAIQWYDVLRRHLEIRVENAIEECVLLLGSETHKSPVIEITHSEVPMDILHPKC